MALCSGGHSARVQEGFLKNFDKKKFLTSIDTCDINIFRKMLRKVLGVMRINQEVFAPQEVCLIHFMS